MKNPPTKAVAGGVESWLGCEPANRANLSSQPDAREASRSSPPYGTFRRKDPFCPGSVASKPLWLHRHSRQLARASSEGFRASMDRNLPSPSALVARRKAGWLGSCLQSSAAVRRRRRPHPIILSNPQLPAPTGSTWRSYPSVARSTPEWQMRRFMSLTPRVCAYTLHGVYRHDLPHLPLGGSAPVLDHLAAVGCDKACRTDSGIVDWKARVGLGCGRSRSRESL